MSSERAPSTYIWETGCCVFVDAVGYSGAIEDEPVDTRQQLSRFFTLFERRIAEHGGRVIDQVGDGMFCLFGTPNAAINAVHDFMSVVRQANDDLPVQRQMLFRCGMSHGDILTEGTGISGPKVNMAARLQALAEPDSVIIDGDAQRLVAQIPGLRFTDLGFRILKGINNPVRAWRVHHPDDDVINPSEALVRAYRTDEDQNVNPRSIAVLPFETRSSNEDDAVLAQGIAIDLSYGLSRSSWLKVISPRSTVNYMAGAASDSEVGTDLGVRYLLKGRVQRAGGLLRITAEMIDTLNNAIVWSEKFDSPCDSIFDIQDRISMRILGQVEPEFLRHASEMAADGRPRTVGAWELLMRSRWHFWRGSAKHIKAAQACAEKALQLDPDNSETLAQLSFCHMTQVWLGVVDDIKKRTTEAQRLARRAVQQNARNANAFFTLGTALSVSGDVDDAIAAQKRALELNPCLVGALGELSRFYAFCGEPEEARKTAVQAIELSPTDPLISLWVRSLAVAAFAEGDLPEAIRLATEAVAKRPDWFFNYALLCSLHALAGDMTAAETAFARGGPLLRNYTMEALLTGHSFCDEDLQARLLKGLRMAGWNG